MRKAFAKYPIVLLFVISSTITNAQIKTFLQGAYSTGFGRHKDVSTTWKNVLNLNALNQPYSGPPFNYTNTESVGTLFFTATAATTDIIDWVLLELRCRITR